MGLSAALLVAVLLEVGLLCRPFEYNWNKYIPGTCGNTTQAYEAVGILNLFADLTIIILPMPVLWRLQLPVAKKVALTFVFGVGILYDVLFLTPLFLAMTIFGLLSPQDLYREHTPNSFSIGMAD